MLTTRTIKEAIVELENKLSIPEAKQEARIIIESILNMEASELISNNETMITSSQLKQINEIIDKRNNKRIPLAYLLEEAHFRNLKLFVNNDVLIPRPETEELVSVVLDEIKERKIHQPTILDLGTGSGCIAISLKLALPAARIFASDISRAALNVAAINAKRYGAEIDFVMGDYLEPFHGVSSSPFAIPIIKGKPPYFDVIVSNPPYISQEDYQKLEPELMHEPKHALVGFPYQDIKREAEALMKENSFMAFEFGFDQAEQLKEIFLDHKIIKDLAGNDRILITKTTS